MKSKIYIRIISIISAFVFLFGGVPVNASYTSEHLDIESAVPIEYGQTREVNVRGSRILQFTPPESGIYSIVITSEDNNSLHSYRLWDDNEQLDCVRLTREKTYYFETGKNYYIEAFNEDVNIDPTFNISVSWGVAAALSYGDNLRTNYSSEISCTIAMGSRHVLNTILTSGIEGATYRWYTTYNSGNGSEICEKEWGSDPYFITPNLPDSFSPIFCAVTYNGQTRKAKFFVYVDDGFAFENNGPEDILALPNETITRDVNYTYDYPCGVVDNLSRSILIYSEISSGLTSMSNRARSYLTDTGFSVTMDPHNLRSNQSFLFMYEVGRHYEAYDGDERYDQFAFYALRDLTINQNYYIDYDISDEQNYIVYRFVPSQTGYYKTIIFNFFEGFPHIAIFDSNRNFVDRIGYDTKYQADNGVMNNDSYTYLTAGNTYYFAMPICSQNASEDWGFRVSYYPGTELPVSPNDPAEVRGLEPEDLGDPSEQPVTPPSTDPVSDPTPVAETTPVSGSAPEDTPAVVPGSSSTSSVPTSNPAPTDAPVIASRNYSIGDFVERLYTVALGRASDPVGKQDWIDAVTMRGQTGADLARGFLYSPEFLGKNVSNEDFVRTLYRTFFDREADTDGLNGWVAVLDNGGSKEGVIEGFINSTEWANLCLLYGVRSGGTGTPNVQVEPNQATIDFATRLYTTCLSRNADQNGLMAWARQLANQRDTGTGAARGFFFSNEFTGQNVSNEEYVNRLYRTFMGREADEAGFSAWVAQLNEGVSREAVFNGFAESPEFARICASYGIIRE